MDILELAIINLSYYEKGVGISLAVLFGTFLIISTYYSDFYEYGKKNHWKKFVLTIVFCTVAIGYSYQGINKNNQILGNNIHYQKGMCFAGKDKDSLYRYREDKPSKSIEKINYIIIVDHSSNGNVFFDNGKQKYANNFNLRKYPSFDEILPVKNKYYDYKKTKCPEELSLIVIEFDAEKLAQVTF
jgi:hypothetical protein